MIVVILLIILLLETIWYEYGFATSLLLLPENSGLKGRK